MNIEKLQKEIKEKRVIINNANDFICKTQQDIANHFCPYSVGDKVLNKDNEEQFIASIKYTSHKPFYSFKIFKIKKDGNPHKYSCYAYYPEHYKAV